MAAAALALELLNAKSWMAGKRATLQIAVRNKENNEGVEGAQVTARIEGAEQVSECAAQTNDQGHAELEFELPHLSGTEHTLVIEASEGSAKGQLRFQLRLRPRVPLG